QQVAAVVGVEVEHRISGLAPAHHEPFGIGQFGGPAERTVVLGPQTTWFALTLDVGHAVRCPQAVPTVRGSRSGPWEIVCSPFRFFLRTAHGPSVFLTRSLSYCATQHTSVPDRGLLHSPVRGVAVVWAVNRCCSKGSVCHSRSRFFPHIREPVQL